MLSLNHLVSILFLFVTTVLMVTFGWIGLADFDWYSYDELMHLPGEKVTDDQLDPHLLLATRVLQYTDRIESKRVGVGGRIAKTYTAFKQILAHKDAELSFEFLLGTDNITAKVYAMHGFQQVNVKRFNELQPYFKRNYQSIYLQSGCSGYFRSVNSVFDLSEAKHMIGFNHHQ